MRKDIEIHIQTADVTINPQNKFQLRSFRWVEIGAEDPAELSRYIYGEIRVPYALSDNSILKNGLYVTIPYTPVYKEIKIRIIKTNDGNTGLYVNNPTNNTPWFEVKASMYGAGEPTNVFASTLPTISETSFFVDFSDGCARIYSCAQSDFNIVNADRQNANCLLACVPGCNYRYPLNGVGLMRWINSTNVLSTALTKTLKDEFTADGVTIQDASYNYDTHQMELNYKAQED